MEPAVCVGLRYDTQQGKYVPVIVPIDTSDSKQLFRFVKVTFTVGKLGKSTNILIQDSVNSTALDGNTTYSFMTSDLIASTDLTEPANLALYVGKFLDNEVIDKVYVWNNVSNLVVTTWDNWSFILDTQVDSSRFVGSQIYGQILVMNAEGFQGESSLKTFQYQAV